MKRTLLLILALLFLFAVEILRVYFIMPFPGSQRANTIDIAYFLNKYVWVFRIVGFIMLLPLAIYAYRHARVWKKIVLSVFIILYGFVFYLFNFKFLADKMFYQPNNKILASVAENKIDSNKLVIGIAINGQAKAYPIEIIGYHHQVQDTVGGEPAMITYCSVCRTGRVFSPFVDGKFQHFRLVGMDHFNAMFEDEDTKSWWRQATGEAITGKMKGKSLKELPSEQMRLSAWIRKYPNTLIMQPDPKFAKQYKGLEGFDAGTINSGLEKRDSGSWKFKSWVVGVIMDGHAKAYDWNDLLKQRIINDTIADKPVLIILEKDNSSFHVWNPEVANETGTWSLGEIISLTEIADIRLDDATQVLKDSNGSVWTMDGLCVEGKSKGQRLKAIPAYQEFWHSWKSFHPGTTIYSAKSIHWNQNPGHIDSLILGR